MLPKGKFDPGHIVYTPGIEDLITSGYALVIAKSLARHLTGDWGDLDEHDRQENELSLKKGYRLLSSYETIAGKIWIITEADRSATTILLPDEY